jgi:hypothetical protein
MIEGRTEAGADLMGGGDAAEVGHVLDGPDGEAAVDEAVVHEHVGHPEQRDPQPLRATPARAKSEQSQPSVHVPWPPHQRKTVYVKRLASVFLLLRFPYLSCLSPARRVYSYKATASMFFLTGASMSLEATTTRRPPAMDVDADVWTRRRRG